ncbi:DUF6069 family protein [Candidatus Leptofilum sp.]|uniref:DUF6069 family protein n=1 Tax=Candidatus Leptofilum sp. TaxID=3241576 RepID=UPI003B597BAB
MTTKIEAIQKPQQAKSTVRKLAWVSPLAMLAAIIANLGLYAAAGAVYPEVTAWQGAGVGQIVGANIVYLLIGTFVFALVARFSAKPARHYLILATIGLLLSLVLPISAGFGYGAPGTIAPGMATVVTLSLMHVISYAISVPLFNRLVLA